MLFLILKLNFKKNEGCKLIEIKRKRKRKANRGNKTKCPLMYLKTHRPGGIWQQTSPVFIKEQEYFTN